MPKLSDIDRLAKAITYWRKHRPLATKENIARVARKFMVHPKTLEKAIKMLSD